MVDSGIVRDVRNVAVGSEVDFIRRYRVQGALSILALWDAKPVKPGHTEKCDRDPQRLLLVSFMHRDRISCTCGADRQSYTFPEWVTDEVIVAAYEAADALQTARGAYNQREASRLHADAVRKHGR